MDVKVHIFIHKYLVENCRLWYYKCVYLQVVDKLYFITHFSQLPIGEMSDA